MIFHIFAEKIKSIVNHAYNNYFKNAWDVSEEMRDNYEALQLVPEEHLGGNKELANIEGVSGQHFMRSWNSIIL